MGLIHSRASKKLKKAQAKLLDERRKAEAEATKTAKIERKAAKAEERRMYGGQMYGGR